MWNEIKNTFSIFRTPSPMELAVKELEEAERQLLVSQTSKDYAIAMVSYHEERIHRLRNYLKEIE